MLVRTPARPPQRPHSQVPVQAPGQHDLPSLRTNQQLSGRVLGVYEGRCVAFVCVWEGMESTGCPVLINLIHHPHHTHSPPGPAASSSWTWAPRARTPSGPACTTRSSAWSASTAGKRRSIATEGLDSTLSSTLTRTHTPQPIRYRDAKYTLGQRLDAYVDEAQPAVGRLTLSLTPVYRRPSHDPKTQEAYPVHELPALTVGMPLQGRVVSVTEHYAFVDCGVVRPVAQGKGKGRRVNGKLYRLDLQERFALSAKQRTARTEAVLAPGVDMQVRA